MVAWRNAQRAQAEQIARAKRRHDKAQVHVAFTRKMAMLKAIHQQLAPLFDLRHTAEDYIFRARDSKYYLNGREVETY